MQGLHLLLQALLQLQGCRKKQEMVFYENGDSRQQSGRGGFWHKLHQRTGDATPMSVGGKEFMYTALTFKCTGVGTESLSLTFSHPLWVSPRHPVPSRTAQVSQKHTEGPCTLGSHEHSRAKKKLETILLPEPSNECLRAISQLNHT